jgi:uncharacterized protein (TIGR00304 family)
VIDAGLQTIGLAFVIVGFVLAIIAVILVAVKGHGGQSGVRGGGILLIGPIPIIFGTDRESVRILVALAIVLIIVVIVFTFLPLLMTR